MRCPVCDEVIDLTSVLPIVEVKLKHQYQNRLNMQVSPVQIEELTFSMCPDCCTHWVELGEGKKRWGTHVLKWLAGILRGRHKRAVRHWTILGGKKPTHVSS